MLDVCSTNHTVNQGPNLITTKIREPQNCTTI